MKLESVKKLVAEPIGCGRCAETPVSIQVLDTGEYFSFYAACPSCHFSCGMKVLRNSKKDEIEYAIKTVSRCFRRAE